MWEWLGDNSGQIQIIIALGAIWLAFKGYKKVLEQIQISHKQTEFAVRQEELHLKLNIINVTNQNIETIGKMLIQLPLLQKECKRPLNPMPIF
ncbi:hypothetical protein [Acinetobacter sp. YH16049]|uniref:hypothetical protein n=1 Tax=Acinetobacter sp. YH16049 TaxID=2601188 RepID=UPI0015D1902B|nr:hypothetical protein [Acinetobacter sp. YH16049]